ncbi:MAG: hypothetical protein KBF76_06975 [Verrucomicrobiales bacterium]|jgi:hypothetical protein|nr:hypothetical protein [Verrucomicrobiales bacterium]HQZ26501.1 hypothetical protein [Verrucomicrobiales bacterium]
MKRMAIALHVGSFWTVLWMSQASAQLPPKGNAPTVISNYRELLDWIPKDSMPRKGTTWSQLQMDAVNDILDKKLKSGDYVADMRLTVSDVPTWGGQLQIYSEIENREGYHIRFFGGFPPEMKPELATVTIGEKVMLSGKIKSLRYHILWNQFTLSIVVDPAEIKK